MATAQQVTQLYQELLGRAPDAGGLAHYSKYGDAGAIRSSILGSAEYTTRQANTRNTQEAARNQQLTDFANQQRTAQQQLLDRQKAEQEGLFGNYENIRKNQEALPALYNRLTSEAGIPGLSQTAQAFKDQIYKVKDRLDRLGEDVLARTTGTLTTESQRRRLETSEAEPLQTNLSRLGTGLAPVADMLSSAQRGVETQMGLQTQQQDRELEPVKLRINAISDRFAREITGFSADRELGLTTLMDKLKRERELSDQEWARAQQLADEERNYARQKAAAASSLANYNTNTGGGGGGTTNTGGGYNPNWGGGAQPVNNNNLSLSSGSSGLSKNILSGANFGASTNNNASILSGGSLSSFLQKGLKI